MYTILQYYRKNTQFGWESAEVHVPITAKDLKDIQRKANKEMERWKRVLDCGFISLADIRHSSGYSPWYSKKTIENAGYYSFTNRNVYKNGAKFYRLSEVERVFPEIKRDVEHRLTQSLPIEDYFDGKLVSIFYPVPNVRVFVEEVYIEQTKHAGTNL